MRQSLHRISNFVSCRVQLGLSRFAVARVAVTYAILGALGLALAIPPGYASPVFPASGFALAVILTRGFKNLPAIWLGSAALNVGVASIHGNLSPISLLVAAGIATGALLQAWAGAVIVRRWSKDKWQHLEQEGDVLAFLTLGGPVACLISATVGLSCLTAAGLVSPETRGYAWWNWFVGDTLGVLLAAPLSLGLLQRQETSWQERLKGMALPLVAVLPLVVVAFLATARWEFNSQSRQLADLGQVLARDLEQRLIAHHTSLDSLANLIEVTPTLDHEQFKHFTAPTLQEQSDIFALSFNPYVTQAQRADFERRMARVTPGGRYTITERSEQGQLVPAKVRPDYVPVGFIQPLAANQKAIGFDIQSEPTRQAAFLSARMLGTTAATAPIRLVQDSENHPGILMLSPAYRVGSGDSNARELIGFAVAVIRIDQMLKIALAGHLPDSLLIELEDPNIPGDQRLLYRTPGGQDSPPSAVSWTTSLQVADRQWSLRVLPTAAYIEQHRPWIAWAVGVIGLLVVALLQILLLAVTGRAALIQRRVDEQTAKIREQADALTQSEQRFQLMVTHAKDYSIIMLDLEGRVVSWNEGAERIKGYRQEEILGQPMSIFYRPEDISAGIPEALLRCADAEGRVENDGWRVRKDGSTFFANVVLMSLKDTSGSLIGYAKITRDITEQKRSEQVLRDSEARITGVIDVIPEGVLLIDGEGRIHHANRQTERIFGHKPTTLVGQAVEILIPPGYRSSHVQMRQTYMANPEMRLMGMGRELYGLHADGREIPVEVALAPMALGETHYTVISIADITQRKATEAELSAHRHQLETLVTERTRELTLAVQAAEAANLAKSAFLANMSHEIRTPLNAIAGMAHLIRRAGLNPRQADQMDKLETASNHLLDVLNAILEISKIEAGKFVLEDAEVRIESIVGNVLSIIRERANDKRIALTSHIASMPFKLCGDSTRLQQALLNYVTNAVKFTEGGQVVVRVRPELEDAESVLVRFEVEDTGIGIAAEALNRLFAAFEQADNSTTRKYGGTGLGLAVTRKLAQIMGGEAGAVSIAGQGSTFWFTARLKKETGAPPLDIACPQEAADETLRSKFRGARVLLADDEPINREIVQAMLEDVSLYTDLAVDGADALRQASENDYALILMDMQMPNLNGLDATREIRKLTRHARTPVIALTANAFAEDRQRCQNAGMNDFIAKPVAPEQFYATLLNWLSIR